MVKSAQRGFNSAWALRNDSSNMTAILRSKYYNESSSDENFEEHYCLGDNNCYCKEKPIKPKLFTRPRSCIFENYNRTNPAISKLDPSRYSSNYNDESSTLNDEDEYNMKSKNYGSFLTKSTNPEDPATKSLENVTNYRRNGSLGLMNRATELIEGNRATNNDENHQPLDLIGVTDDETKKKSSYAFQADDDKTLPSRSELSKDVPDLKRLSDFRKDHYFETHSTENLVTNSSDMIPAHECVHRFELDDRLLPKPLNFDVYGTSRCVICGKPMKNRLEQIDLIDERTRNFPHYYKYGLVPKNVFLGGGRQAKIELVTDNSKNNYFGYGSRRKAEYFNTLALRFQKGVY